MMNGVACSDSAVKDTALIEMVENYDVVIVKHCYPASDVLEDIGIVDPSLPRQSLENYREVYRLLREEFDKHPDTLLIVWTLPPQHRLYQPSEGDRNEDAARATLFSNWLKTEFLAERGPHPNIRVWNFRGIDMYPNTNFLKYEYEVSHNRADSHPNTANNEAGPRFVRFIVDSIVDFVGGIEAGMSAKVVFLHHSTEGNVYEYPELGRTRWFEDYNDAHRTEFKITELWYPSEGNMPVHCYRPWLAG
ncbi:hypothetical protein ACFLX5_05425 [Chloroflexota bacterium]